MNKRKEASIFFREKQQEYMLEEILDIRNVRHALKQVTSNKGASGVDGMSVRELNTYIENHYQTFKLDILESRYKPQAVRKVEIPKPGGGVRMLGIPTVLDRLVQQCISQRLSQLWEPEFHECSYGFRPNRNAHQAVGKAKDYINEGYCKVVELDLEKFFDKVNHDYLMSLLAKRIADKPLLKLVRAYLTSGIMEGGATSPRTEGTPQGSPLSPLLSNILLHELDKELDKRGLRFVRYADDCSIYTKSVKAAERVLASITTFIEVKLHLKVNTTKSQVSHASASTLLGYSFYT
jgi:RNA-directed DNA polymerase